uniref:T200B protein n=1 Tax=Sphenodon punctatus TaxID=8508 RepID=A0A8D0H3G5_SPHPU
MRNQDPSGNKPPGPAHPSRQRGRRFRRKTPPEVIVKGQLRMRSPPGAFVMVGVSVVLVGMTIAVVGYWPHRTPHIVGSGARLGNFSSTGDIKKEVKVPSHPRPFPHSEKLKLIGPVIMGIGLFIFICANTMLYENRDMETRLLMQKGLYSMSLGLPQDTIQEDNYCQRRTTPYTLQANAECVEGCYEVDLSSSGFHSCSSPGNKWADCYGSNRLQTTAQLLHNKGVSPSISLLSVQSDSGNSMEGNLNLTFTHGAESIISSAVNALSLPVIKLNNCILENKRVSQGKTQDRQDIPAKELEALRLSWALLPRCNSISTRGDEHGDHVVIDMDSETPSIKKLLYPECTKREFRSDMQLHNSGHSKSLDLGRPGVLLVAPIKDRKHRSWPRLDHINLIGYAKLETMGESSDKLVEPTDQLSRGESRLSAGEEVIEMGSAV